MNSRPLLDYLAFDDDLPEPFAAEPARDERPVDPLDARLKDLEARLRASQPVAAAPKQDLTLSAQIDAILKRKAVPLAASQPTASHQPTAFRHVASQFDRTDQPRPVRVVLDPPPSVPVENDLPSVDHDFLRFSEAVYLIGQAAKRFIEEPQIQPQPRQVATAPSTGDIEALSAVLRETVSAFRSVADDLAVSAGEIRNHATRPERQIERRPERMPDYRAEPPADHRSERRRPQPARYRDEDEILELRENIADLQDRLDDLLHARRRARY